MTKTIRILYPMTGGDMGGSHIALTMLLKKLPSYIEPIIYLDQVGKFSNFLKNNNISYKLLQINKYISAKPGIIYNITTFFRNYCYIVTLLKQEKIDLIHVSDDALPVTFIFYAIIKNIPLIWHHHNVLPKSRLVVLAYFLSKNNIFVSKYLYSLARAKEGEIIYNPIEISSSINNGNHQIQSNNNGFKIGFFSNLYTRKNPFVVINACKALISKGYKISAYFFGDDREITKKELKEMIKDLAGKELFYFYDFSHDAISYIKQMDVIVAPAFAESFGRVPIEAMSCKIPVIANKDGGHKEIITDQKTGLFFDANDANDLCEKIIFLINNQDIKEAIINNAYVEVMEKYDIEVHVQKILHFYNKVLNVKNIKS